MASTTLKETKDGKKFYEIRVRMGEKGQTYATRWYIPTGWSQKTIERELGKVARDFERQCKTGEVKTRKQVREEQEKKTLEAARLAEEEAKIPTLKQFAESVFMPSGDGEWSEHSRSSFQGILDKHIYPVLGSAKLPDITGEQIANLLDQKKIEGMKASTRVKYYTVLRLVFKMAYKKKVIVRNPMEDVDRPKATKTEGKDGSVKAFSEAEAKYIRECADLEPLQWKTMIYLLLFTGCRKGEATGLRWDKVNFKENTVTIANNLCYTPQKGIYDDTPKSGKSRVIPVPQIVMNLLAELRDAQKGNILSFSKAGRSSGYVFRQEGTELPMHPDSPTRYLKKLQDRYGIEDFHPHKLRHTFASIALKNGADIVSVSEILGHASPDITMRVYASAYEEGKKRASDIFSSALAVNK